MLFPCESTGAALRCTLPVRRSLHAAVIAATARRPGRRRPANRPAVHLRVDRPDRLRLPRLRFMHEHAAQSPRRRRFVAITDCDHVEPIFRDRSTDCEIDVPNQPRGTDLAYIATLGGFVYLAAKSHHEANYCAILLLHVSQVVLPLGSAPRERDLTCPEVLQQRLVHEHAVVVRVEADNKGKRQVPSENCKDCPHQFFLPMQYRSAFGPSKSDVRDHPGLKKAAVHLGTMVRHQIPFDEPGVVSQIFVAAAG